MEVQIKPEQMFVDAASNTADGFLRNAGKDGVAELLENGGAHSGDTIYAAFQRVGS